ncbi:MAG: hypothetical protein ABIJ81_01220 [Patescibacteria group bacterium]
MAKKNENRLIISFGPYEDAKKAAKKGISAIIWIVVIAVVLIIWAIVAAIKLAVLFLEEFVWKILILKIIAFPIRFPIWLFDDFVGEENFIVIVLLAVVYPVLFFAIEMIRKRLRGEDNSLQYLVAWVQVIFFLPLFIFWVVMESVADVIEERNLKNR